MSHEVGEIYDVYNEAHVRARIEHQCAACDDTIRRGHQYVKVKIVFGGTVETVKRCLRCQEIHEHLRELDPGCMWPDERLGCGEDYEDHWGGPPPDDIARLAFLTADEAQMELSK